MNSLICIKNHIANNIADLNYGFKCRCCNDKMNISEKKTVILPNGIKRTIVKKSKRQSFLRRPNAFQEKVNKAVEHLIDFLKKDEKILEKINRQITKEIVAKLLNVPEHQVKVAFHNLNLMGKLSQGVNKPPHDSKRDFWGRHDSSWIATKYTIL